MELFSNEGLDKLYFSECLNSKIIKSTGHPLGVFTDFFVDFSETFPKVLAIQFKKNRQTYYVDWNSVYSFSEDKILLKENCVVRKGKSFPMLAKKTIEDKNFEVTQDIVDYPPIGRVILDRQIVDTNGKKVVRVNDIVLIHIGDHLRVTHVEIDFKSLLRRLGLEKILSKILKYIHPKSSFFTIDGKISWKYVHALGDKNLHSNVQLNLSNEELTKIHPADLADILEDLDLHSREKLFKVLGPELKMETLTELENEALSTIIESENEQSTARLLENMDSDDAADILMEIGQEKALAIIKQIDDKEVKKELKELIKYEEDSAGGLMNTEIFDVRPSDTKEKILYEIPNMHEEIGSLYDLFVVNESGGLIGTCALRDLLICKHNAVIEEIMNKDDIKFVYPESSWKEIAQLMSKYNLINIPVVNESFKLIGTVSIDDVLPWAID